MSLPGPNAVAVGMFDGVHRGHVFVLEKLREEAGRIGGRAVVLTFDRHPCEVVAPEKAPLYIMTLERRIELLRDSGADEVIALRFEPEVAALSPEQFAESVLSERLSARCVVVGPNFRFGAGRTGNIERLEEIGRKLGYSVNVVPPVQFNRSLVSSTRIRSLVSRGRVKEAAELLGRRFELQGRVEPGVGVGRTLGFPTANLLLPERQIVPAEGVYAAEVCLESRVRPVAVSIGTRASFGDGRIVVEAYILDFEHDIYGQEITLSFVDRLRDQQKFASREALKAQIRQDVEEVRALFASNDR